MKTLKTVLKYLKQMGIEVDAKMVVAAAGLLVLVVGFLLVLWKKRRDKAATEEPVAWDEPPISATQAPVAARPKSGVLLKDWKAFLQGIPGVLRRSVYQFTPIIVFGDTGSGKSALIDTFSDWQRQARQYPGAAYNGENLDIYLGTQTLTLEFPSRLLMMPTQWVRRAMVRALGPLLRRCEPVVVVALSVKSLREKSPDYLLELAESIRGKLDVLAGIRGRPVTVRLALTHSDSVDGFYAWSQFSRNSHIASSLALNPQEPNETLAAAGEMHRYFPLALTSLSADDYLQFILFTERFPEALAPLGDFLKAMFAESPMSETPLAQGIYLTAQSEKLPGGNPLLCAQPDSSQFNPIRKHQYAALALATTLVACTVGLYQHERDHWLEAQTATDEYHPLAHRQTERALRQTILDYTNQDRKRLISMLGLGFFDDGRKQVRQQFIEEVRRSLLLPEIARAGGGQQPLGRTVYLLGLLYSTNTNELGKLVASRISDWSRVTEISEDLIESYVGRSHDLYEGDVDVVLPKNVHASAVYELAPWVGFLRGTELLMARLPMDDIGLAQLQKQAEHLTVQLQRVRNQSAALAVYDALLRDVGTESISSLGTYADHLEVTRAIEKMSTPLEALMRVVSEADLSLPVDQSMSLRALCAALGVAIETKEQEKSILGFDFGTGQTWTVELEQWHGMVHKSKLRKMVSAFLHHDRLGLHEAFFPEGKAELFKPVLMNPYGAPVAEFTGDAILDGIYTRSAFAAEVLPSVMQMSDLLTMLDFDPELAGSLRTFLHRKVYDYAEDYGQQLADFYSDFGFQARSSQAVQIVLAQMLDPVSPFEDFLSAVKRNASFDFGSETPELLEPMLELASEYEPFMQILKETEDGGDLKRYRAILTQLRRALGGAASAEAGAAEAVEPAGDEPGIRQLLSPAGQISLDILQGVSGNYLELVDEWISSVQLSGPLAKPFREPVLLLYQVGLRDIERTIADQWARRIAIPMEEHLAKFPFNRSAQADITAGELTAFFHPVRGLFNQSFTRLFEPVLRKDKGRYQVRRSKLGQPRIAADVLASINRVARMSRTLWDKEGNPRPLKVAVKPRLFGAMVEGLAGHTRQALTLVYLSSGQTALFNFNQKPSLKALELDWTRLTTAQVGIQLTNKTTGEHQYPGAVIAQDSHWSFFRLLTKGTSEELAWSWSFGDAQQGQEVQLPVTFELDEDPWDLFTIPNATRLSGL